MMTKRKSVLPALAILIASLAVAGGCDTGAVGGIRGAAPPPVPLVMGLSTNQASVGDPVSFVGSGFVAPTEGWVDIHFQGTFYPDDGSDSNQVDFRVPLQRGSDPSVVTWERFGNYRVPFIPGGAQLGRFEGSVSATNNFFPGSTFFPDGEGSVMQEADSIQTTFYMLPSLVVLDNRAFSDDFIADCVDPAVNVLGFIRYALRVRALGLEPTAFEFVMTDGLMQQSPTTGQWEPSDASQRFRYTANGVKEFAIGHRWMYPPSAAGSFSSMITATAKGVGVEKSVEFPMIVRRWTYSEFFGSPELAELLPAVPVSGCIPGGPSSLQVSYKEEVSETRAREFGVSVRGTVAKTLTQSQMESYEVTNSESFARTNSQNVTIGNTSTVGQSTLETDLFSNANSTRRAQTLGRETETGLYNEVTLSATGTVASDVEDILSNQNVAGLSPFVARAFNTLLERFEMEDGVESSLYGGLYSRSGQEFTNIKSNTSETLDTTTRGLNLARGTSFNQAQTYEQQLGIATTRAVGFEESFGQAVTNSQQVRETLGTEDREVITQSSTESVAIGNSAFVWAALFGTWYRQTSRFVQRGALIGIDLCGNPAVLGDLSHSSWEWAADLGIGNECPPPTNLNPAECRIPPCTAQ